MSTPDPHDGSRHVDRGMVLAAGLGLRMRPITERIPKPLVEVAGRTLLDRILDRFDAAGVTTAVVNTHHRAEAIARHLKTRKRPRIILSHEAELLETGGGVARALPRLGAAPFYVVNGDALWLDGPGDTLRRLARAWRDDVMDALLLVHSTVTALGVRDAGDFFLSPEGVLRRRGEREVAPFVFAGIQLLHPRLFADAPDGAFSLNLLYDRAAARGRLFGIRHDGLWFHVGTPEQLRRVEAELAHAGLIRRPT